MILVRAPLRLSLGGGGTDLPSYYSRFGSTFVAASIDQHVYLAIHKSFGDDFIVKYSELERVKEISAIRHPLVRECLTQAGIDRPLEVVSFADIPGGTGLGSSGAFTVGLLKGLYAHTRRVHDARSLAEDACAIEIERLHEKVGKQDQYASAFGGLNRFDIAPDGTVTVTPVQMPAAARLELEERLCLFFTNTRRSASEVLKHQDDATRKATGGGDDDMLRNLHQTRELGLAAFETLREGNLSRFATQMNQQWEMKRSRSPGTTTAEIDRAWALGLANGALGGKLLGAGGGGFLMFLAEDRTALRRAMQTLGYPEVPFRFTDEGAQMLVRT
jgi:D-glycero-alpha-D-manno-heptose-7-phosphate kinase